MYQEQPWANPFAPLIAELLLRQGDVRARALSQQGAARADAVRSIADLVTGLPGQLQAQRVAADEAQMRQMALTHAQHDAALQPVQDAVTVQELAARRAAAMEGRPAAAFGDAGPSPIEIPGVPATPYTPAVPGYTITPQTAEQMAAAHLVAVQAEAVAKRAGELPKTRQITARNPDGSETIQIVRDEPGVTFTSAPEPPKVTYGQPVTVMVQGRPVLARPGSDGSMLVVHGMTPPPDQPRDQRLVQVMGPNGTPVWTWESAAAGMPAAQAPRAVTGQERQALAFYNRAKEAVDTLTTLRAGGSASLEDVMANQNLLQQYQLGANINVLQNEAQQQYRQAQRAFTEARLRKESGAAIPMAEYDNDARTYFAQPGDSKAVIEQKRKMRQTVLEGLRFASGRAYDEFYGDGGASAPPPPPRKNPFR